ncbi:hypothetical protein R5R35_004372 [Gryllus longicercus]|uniref:Uncharacterized protein n=1 Tax=Gryllus longicercus TaxID=2509291 RepID=A0AAN9V5S3_9ORTH
MTGTALELLFQEALDTPLLPLEDVFLTGIVGGSRLGIPLVHVSRFWTSHPRFDMSTSVYHHCAYHHMLAMHHVTPEKIRQLWKALVQLQPARECDTFLMHILGHLFTPGSYQVVTDDPW